MLLIVLICLQNIMVSFRSSNKKYPKKSDDLAFVPNVFSGLAGVILGWIIANSIGII